MKVFSPTVTGSLDITGSISLNGSSITAWPSGGSAFPYTGSAEITGSLAVNNIPVQFSNPDSSIFRTADFTYIPPQSTTNNYYVSQSGLHHIDASSYPAGVSSSLNIYYHIDDIENNSETQIYVTLPSGSGQVILYRTLISASDSTVWWSPATTGFGNTSLGLNRNASYISRPTYANSTNASFQFVKSDGGNYFKYLYFANEYIFLYHTGSAGTPIV